MWYSGSVAEAVDKSKREKKLFMVFIEGKDDVSSKMAEILSNLKLEILNVVKREVVAFKVEDGTDNCKLFGQIYPILMIPSIYFISNTGVNLEVIPGFVEEQEFMDRLDKVLLVHKTNLSTPVIPKPVPTATPAIQGVVPQLSTLAASSISQSNAAASVAATMVAANNTNNVNEPSSGANSQPNIREKLALAQQKLEQLRIKKVKEEEEKTKQQELERIKSGKELAAARVRREELEMAELIKQREKEKKEAAEARKRILAQIEADKEERRRKNEQLRLSTFNKTETTPDSNSPSSTGIKSNANEARIQFRFPDGSFKNQTFAADDPLCALRQFVIDTTPYRNFSFSTSYPKRGFTSDDLTTSLRDLGLSPSSVLLVLTNPSVVSKATSIVSTNIFYQIWPLIMTPIFWLWTFITSLFRPPPAPNSFTSSRVASSSSLSQPSSSSQESTSKSQQHRPDIKDQELRQKRIRESKLLNRDGNVAQLRDNREDKDDDGTWNGNSTQQM